MTELGDSFREWNKAKQEKRWNNFRQSLEYLKQVGIEYKVLDEGTAHVRVGDFDFWPTTGKFFNKKTGKKGRGVFNLVRELKV